MRIAFATMARILSMLVAISILSGTVLAQNVEIKAPAQVPPATSAPIDCSYLGLMVETTSWARYASTPFSVDLIQNIVNKTGVPMVIRVGGTSGDQAIYNASQKDANHWLYDKPTDGLLVPISLGQDWLAAFSKIPSARYILEVPLANSSVEETVDFTREVLKGIKPESLEAIEVGNEPNLYDTQTYRGQTKRPKPYTVAEYVGEFLKYSNAIASNVSLPSRTIFHAGTLADGSAWDAQDLYDKGLGTSDKVKAFGQHYYQTNIRLNKPTLRANLLDHNGAIVRKTDGQVAPNVNYLRHHLPGPPLILSEAGSALGQVSPEERKLDAVLGSALWEVDWLLLSMTRNVSRVNMNQCSGCNFASWWPGNGDTDGAVHAQYYGLALVADWLGLRGPSRSGALRVASLWDAKYPSVSPYAGYVGGVLDRVAMVDLNEWNMTSTSTRPSRTVTLDVPPTIKGAELRRLKGKGTDALAADITYAGMKYTPQAPKGERVQPKTENVNVKDGKATFELQASEAVLITLH